MKTLRAKNSFAALLLGTVAAGALMTAPAWAQESTRHFDIPAQDAALALNEYARQAGVQIVFPYVAVQGRRAPSVQGDLTSQAALALLTEGMALRVSTDRAGMITLRSDTDPQGGSAAGDGAEVEALIVTAQKREEDIQDVPIAISAFTQEALEAQKIEGGFDLLKAIPNVTFSKNNFTSYNFSIRGIGTKAVSATTDPGVAVSFNNVALIQNRLFEQEYFDIERVEVLRGPQGTLYGRNATAGVINVISAKPDMDEFKGWVKGEVGNYHSKRLSAMVNVPLLEDKLAIRLAGALTDRQGYDYNTITQNAVNGRDLWSGRITLGFNPTERIHANLIWERFKEDDNRSRTGKQLCHRDDGPDSVGGVDPAADVLSSDQGLVRRTLFSGGCKPGSLYDDGAFGTPNGMAMPLVWGLIAFRDSQGIGYVDEDGDEIWEPVGILPAVDPYGGMRQSEDLRVIASLRDPIYQARADLVELNVDVDLMEGVSLASQTAYNKDYVYSAQDYNRFNTVPIFTDTSTIYGGWGGGESPYRDFAKGGFYCDPQLGCSNTMVGFDVSRARASQFSHEFRISSDSAGSMNFSAGVNYTRFKALVDYYVFYNIMSAYASQRPFNYFALGTTFLQNNCSVLSFAGYAALLAGESVELPVPADHVYSGCPYIDPNPLESINGEGHNYFRSKNPYKLTSGAAFGELYWNVSPDLKLTVGIRYTDDRKTFVPVPTQVLLAPSIMGGGTVSRGYPEQEPIEQHWGEWTGRLGFDWKLQMAPGEAMLYAFYSRGYKGGGANPPAPDFGSASLNDVYWGPITGGLPPPNPKWLKPILEGRTGEFSRTFRPEYVNAFEAGVKSTLFDGALRLNGSSFFYDYTDYQVSQIRERTAVNENFDARVWGLEIESVFSPSRNFNLIANVGYLDTAIADGMKSINIANRTQGNPDYVLAKPWPQLPSNCVVPTHVAAEWLGDMSGGQVLAFWELCGGYNGVISLSSGIPDTKLGGYYNPANYPEINGGSGIAADLSGNELPNSPHWTVNLGGQYGFDFVKGWRATFRGDAYWQSQSWARVYNAVNDKLHGWYNANLSLWLENDDGLKIELYAKNLLDKTPITDAFINSDDTALTTNVFTLDPRLIGLSVRREF